MAIAGFVRKMSGTSEVDTDTMNRAVSKMVEEALKYNQVESVLESGEEEDIFSPEYFEKLSDVKMPATKLELLIKMLRKQIKEYGKVNQLAAKSFQEMLEKTIAEYHERRKHLTAEEAGAAQEETSEEIIKNATEQALQILKEMGCNGIRCSHNPPAPELLDLCDRMGFIVMDEAFDMWRKKKTAHDYARYFNEWHERDLNDFILRDRNHPSVFMWSIGNEVLEQWSDAKADTLSLEEANLILNFGHSSEMLAKEGEESVNSLLTKKLVSFVKGLDPTRPVTAGCNEPNSGNHLFRSGVLDVIGYNYHNKDIPNVPANFPDKPFIITESNSALMTRGYYRMPSDRMFIWPKRWDKSFADSTFACSSYENCHVPWGNTHEESLKLVRDNDFISGQYVWTGFDYIGEPTPYGWPARSSYFGIVDLAGFPKDVYYLYQSEWTDKQVLHLFPHWNWTPGQEIDMWCYYNQADEVELFVNGKSQGVKRKDLDNLHVAWRVKFEPGTVKVIARERGKVVAEKEICTAGKPAEIRLTPDRSILTADGKDLCFVTVEVLDEKGNLCPDADNLVNFTVQGNGFIAGVDNGNPVSMERFKDEKRKAFYGKCLVVIQNDGKPGKAKLTATSEGLRQAVLKISAEEL